MIKFLAIALFFLLLHNSVWRRCHTGTGANANDRVVVDTGTDADTRAAHRDSGTHIDPHPGTDGHSQPRAQSDAQAHGYSRPASDTDPIRKCD